ncbi:paramyosin-like protein [Rhynchospora pubera]|uniref:Paramyosin-like protein n=1 Tax=Rhynchospora pubera TaxID=906938 RepID=A0AAV8F5D5_9POAL|nr:paramyosin-like protein [Rhynchospora pubera]
MAKKKTSHKKEAAPMAEPTNNRTTTSNGTDATHETREVALRDPSPDSDKTEKLKQLNEILLKQTKEKREQVSQLQSQIEEMGFEFSFTSETEREVMHVILSAFVVNLSIEISEKLREMEVERQKEVERGVVLEEKMESLKEEVQSEIEKGRLVEKEKSVILGNLDLKEKEVVEMGKMVKDLEMVKSDVEKWFLKVREEKEVLVVEGKEKDGVISNLRNEKNEVETDLGESKKLVEKFKSKFEEEVKDKEVKVGQLKNEKEALEEKIVTLEKERKLEIHRLSSQTEALNQKNAEKEGEIRDLKATIDGKNDKIVGLEKEIDILQLAIEEANKRGFWTWIYPAATTILAAISFIYAARAR